MTSVHVRCNVKIFDMFLLTPTIYLFLLFSMFMRAPLWAGSQGKSAVARRLWYCHQRWQFCLICFCATNTKRCEENTLKLILLLKAYGTMRMIRKSSERNDKLRDSTTYTKTSNPPPI
jgi:hypothetical protein